MRRERRNTEILTLRGRKEEEESENKQSTTTNHDRNIRNARRNPGEKSWKPRQEGTHVTSFQEAELRKDHNYFQHSKGNGTKRLRNEWTMKNKREEEKLLT